MGVVWLIVLTSGNLSLLPHSLPKQKGEEKKEHGKTKRPSEDCMWRTWASVSRWARHAVMCARSCQPNDWMVLPRAHASWVGAFNQAKQSPNQKRKEKTEEAPSSSLKRLLFFESESPRHDFIPVTSLPLLVVRSRLPSLPMPPRSLSLFWDLPAAADP